MWLHQFDFQNTLAAGCKNEDLAEWQPRRPEDADKPPPPAAPDGAGADEDGEEFDDSGPLGELGPGGWQIGGPAERA